MNIQSENYQGALCTLVDGMGMPVEEGRVVKDEHGDVWSVTGGRAPHNANSTGHVFALHVAEDFERTFYVGVLGMSWVVA